MRQRIVLLSLISALLICGVCGVAGQRIYAIVRQADLAQEEYDNSLRAIGIEPTLEGVERFIKDTLQLGKPFDDALARLKPLGFINSTDLSHSGKPDCMQVDIWLARIPGDKFPLYFIPGPPVVYTVEICQSNGIITQSGNLERMDN